MTTDLLSGFLSVASPRPVAREVLHATDGGLSVWNYDSGMGESRPDWTTTLRWMDAQGLHDLVFDGESGRLGWVEAVGTFATHDGPVYVLVSEDKLGATDYATLVSAFRLVSNGGLRDARGFFPRGLPGVNEAGSAVAWEYVRRAGGDVFPRPIEARLDENDGRIDVFLRTAFGSFDFALDLRGNALLAVGLVPTVLAPFVTR